MNRIAHIYRFLADVFDAISCLYDLIIYTEVPRKLNVFDKFSIKCLCCYLEKVKLKE